jgi:MYXO-CTERM domain-containing protein
MTYLTRFKKRMAVLTLCAGTSLLPFALAAQTTTPSPGTTTVEQRDDHHDYGWIGLLGLIGLAGLLGRRRDVHVAERTSTR